MTDHFRINRIADAVIQKPGQAFQVVNEVSNHAVGNLGRQQAANQIGLIAAQRLLNLMRREAVGLAEFQPANQLVGGAPCGGNDHHIAGLRVLRHNTGNAQVTLHIRQTTPTKFMQLTLFRPCLRNHTHVYPSAATRNPFSRSAIKSWLSSIPVEIRSSVSEIPAAARASGAMPAWVMVAA